MRALLLLSIVGAAIYAFLVATHNVISDSKVEDTFAGQTQPYHPIDRKLRSWGSNLPALAISQQPSPRRPQQNARYGPRPTEENYGQYSERTAGAGDNPLPHRVNQRLRKWTSRLNGPRYCWPRGCTARPLSHLL